MIVGTAARSTAPTGPGPDPEPEPGDPQPPTPTLPTPAVGGVACDIDGVLRVGSEPIPGAIETIRYLKTIGMPLVLVSNTTSVDSGSLARDLVEIGFPVTSDDVVSAPAATAAYVRQHHDRARYFFVGDGQPFTAADGLQPTVDDPDVVIVGGGGPGLDYRALNQAFNHVLGGAELIAMHKNRCWKTQEGLALDSGPFVEALESATGVSATLIGKPQAEFFRLALARKQMSVSDTLMVGDDIESDVLGAQAVGMRGALTKTGKYRPTALETANGEPDYVIDSIADLVGLIEAI